MPPSPVVMFLLPKKLKQPTSPIVPSALPSQAAPGECAASSISHSPWRSQIDKSSAIRDG